MDRRERLVVATMLFFSGFAALAYEVVWLRRLGQVLGRETLSMSIILASFMGGMAFGTIYFGRIADRLKRPLFAFGIVELAVGLGGFALLGLFEALGPIYRLIVSATGIQFGDTATLLFKPALAFPMLTMQTFFMGGTMPVLCRHVVRAHGEIGSGLGALYAINTFGAVAGCAAAGLWLIPGMGGYGTIGVAIATNVAVGLAAMALGRNAMMPADERPEQTVIAPDGGDRIHLGPRFLVGAYFMTGMCAIALEVLWTRQLVIFLGGGVYAFSIMLAVFLLGLTAGSAAYARRLSRYADQERLFAVVQVTIGVFAMAGLLLFHELPYLKGLLRLWTGAQSWAGVHAVMAALCFSMMILPTIGLGVAFPLVNRLHVRSVSILGRGVASLLAANGVGGILGSFLAAFVLIPRLGVHGGTVAVAAVHIAIGAVVLATGAGRPLRRRAATVGAIALVTAVMLAATSSLPPVSLVNERLRRRALLFQDENSDVTLAVFSGTTGERMLAIDGNVTAADTFTDIVVHKLLAHTGMLVHPRPENVLVIGFGLGVTANSVLKYPEVKRLDVVDLIENETLSARYFEHVNEGVLAQDRLHLAIGDGRDFIATSPRLYDVISFNAVHPRLGADLYTREFYATCRAKLKPGGLVVAWMPTNWMTQEELRGLLGTFAEVFPGTALWYANPAHLVAVGGAGPVTIDYAHLRERMASGPIAKDLAASALGDPESLLGLFLMGPDRIRRYTGGAPMHTDNLPFAAYSRVVEPQIENGIIEALVEAREPVFPYLRNVPEPAALKEVLSRRFDAHADFVYAELYQWSYAAKAQARARIQRALTSDPDDRYVRFISMGYGATPGPIPAEIRFPREVAPAFAVYTPDPRTDPASRLDAGLGLLADGDHAGAEAAFEEALALRPDYTAAYTNLGILCAATGRKVEALAHLSRAIFLDRRSWQPHYHAARILAADGDDETVRGHLEAVIALQPYHVEGMMELAALYERRGERAKADALRLRAVAAGGGDR